MTDLLVALETIKTWHRENNPVVADSLQRGLSEAEIREVTAPLPFDLSDELYALYGWHNGTERDYPFLFYHRFLPLEEAVRSYQDFKRLPFSGWQEGRLPVFQFQDEAFIVDLSGARQRAGPVRFFFLEDTEEPTVYASLSDMLTAHAEAFKTGLVTAEDAEYGVIGYDEAAFKALHDQLNPGLPYPYWVSD